MTPRNIIRNLVLFEVSAVDWPAQEGAKALLTKRHVITSLDKSQSPAPAPVVPVASPKEKSAVTEAEIQALNDKLALLTKANARLTALLGMSTEERSYFERLPSEAQTSEIEKGTALTKARAMVADDEVVYTTASGLKLRKSQDPLLIQLAKSNDDLAGKLAQETLEKLDSKLEKRACDLYKNLDGESSAKCALLRAVEGITNEATRAAVGEMLTKADNTMSLALSQQSVGGFGPDVTDETSAHGQLEKLAKAHAAANPGVTFHMAYAHVSQATEQGRALLKRAMREDE